ncbi:unnamed protein product [Ilex paraguariensis]|uniref:Uncharacterized protein n=1 Tax=Ilex paraguariensis TaxID=185542 RepID=A0ABC8UDI1_9AQUA
MFILIHESIGFYSILEGLLIVSPGLLHHLVCSLIEHEFVMACRGIGLLDRRFLIEICTGPVWFWRQSCQILDGVLKFGFEAKKAL